MEETRTTIGMRIAEVRKDAGLSQMELAELSGVGHSTISKWESGFCMPRNDGIQKIAQALDVNFKYLLYGTGEKKKEDTERKVEAKRNSTVYSWHTNDEQKLRNLSLCIAQVPTMNLSDDEKRRIYNTLSEFRKEIESKMFFGNN